MHFNFLIVGNLSRRRGERQGTYLCILFKEFAIDSLTRAQKDGAGWLAKKGAGRPAGLLDLLICFCSLLYFFLNPAVTGPTSRRDGKLIYDSFAMYFLHGIRLMEKIQWARCPENLLMIFR